MDAVFVVSIPYAIMIFCYVKIMNHFHSYQHCLSDASKRVQQDLNKVLLAEACTPVLTAFLPLTLQIIGALTNFDLVFATFICGILYSWIPIGNAICVLFFVTAYRTKLKQLFICLNPKLSRLMPSPATATAVS